MIAHSEQLDQLFTALSAAQAEFPLIEKGRRAHYGNYADLSDMLNPLWPTLKKYGLCVYDFTSIDTNGFMVINVRLAHSSGQFTTTQCTFREGLQKDADWGGCLTFRRRYLYRSILGIAIPNDIDDHDDHNEEAFIGAQELQKLTTLPTATQEKIKSFNKINDLSQLTISQYDRIMAHFNKNK